VALNVAARDPAEAERLSVRMTWHYDRTQVVLACRRMATVDLPRARRLAATVDNGLHGLALGLMADALPERDRAQAQALLAQAFARFADRDAGRRRGVWSLPGEPVLAASLLPIVERVDPDHLEEYVWRAAALRWFLRTVEEADAERDESWRELRRLEASAALAFYLVRYDRALARAILRPLAVPSVFTLGTTGPVSTRRGLRALVLRTAARLDPAWAVELLGAVDDADSARIALAEALVLSEAELLSKARKDLFSLENVFSDDE
jgi:hypothetical protein